MIFYGTKTEFLKARHQILVTMVTFHIVTMSTRLQDFQTAILVRL